jgi:hypothetical protein
MAHFVANRCHTPFTGDDLVIECGANDSDYSPPELWPDWTDLDRFEPFATDAEWLNNNPTLSAISGGGHDSPTDSDWDEYHRWSEWQDRLEAMHWIDGDEALAAAGLPVG